MVDRALKGNSKDLLTQALIEGMRHQETGKKTVGARTRKQVGGKIPVGGRDSPRGRVRGAKGKNSSPLQKTSQNPPIIYD